MQIISDSVLLSNILFLIVSDFFSFLIFYFFSNNNNLQFLFNDDNCLTCIIQVSIATMKREAVSFIFISTHTDVNKASLPSIYTNVR